ncbi:MAG: dienelactone hydrolase family protein [Bacteroidota bacterium]
MEKEIARLIGDYQDRKISRRGFMQKVAAVSGGTALALTLLPVLDDNTLSAATKSSQAAEIVGEFITYQAFTGDMRAFLAKPSGGKKLPAVIVIHENRGLVPHIQDVTRRMAQEGFLALAPDALSPVGGTPEDVSNAGELFAKLNPDETTKNFVAAVKYLKSHPDSNGKVGCTGFCWGGAMTNQVAVNCPELDAAVPYYGRVPDPADVPKIKAPVMAHFAENDERINAGIAGFEEALKQNNKEYQIFMYPGTQHAFNNDSNPARYHADAARLAWERTVGFFKEKLK